MNTLFLATGEVLQTPQNGDDTIVMVPDSTAVSAGSNLMFGSTSGHVNIFDTGIALATDGTYHGDTVVLGAGTADVVVGGLHSIIYGGTGAANIFYSSTPGTLVTGSGDLNIVGNPRGVGVFFGGGVVSMTHDSSGTTVHTGLGATDHLFAGGPVTA